MQPAKTNKKFHNRLSKETSPYLLQHADNPVDWYPWSDEAFQKAKNENKPVFLSIGYSSCHWCHVMEHESFENEEIAKIMNQYFVCIKVDREQRPDIDDIYMKSVQMMTGSGGWPLSVFLTPDGRPFYGGTYYPPEDHYNRPGFKNILNTIAQAWKEEKEKLVSSADKLTGLLAQNVSSEKTAISEKMLDDTFDFLKGIFDPANGGFGSAPKFPQTDNIIMLLRYYNRSGNADALQMATISLDKMADGGIHDQLGGGFHRYSTDAVWLVPHFEKMLYDQALISKAYLLAYQATGNEKYAKIATNIFDYVLRDMTAPAGGFYSAEDADSAGKEGTFYIWSKKQVENIIGKDNAKIFNSYFGLTEHGNFEGSNILYISNELNLSGDDVQQIISDAKNKLFEVRSKRTRPFRDEKIITAWNGLMISSLAFGGAILDQPKYINAAKRSADFILTNLKKNSRLKRYYIMDQAVDLGVLDDYAFLTMALIDLYQATFEPRWLSDALLLNSQMTELFPDKDSGGFYLTGTDAQKLIARSKPDYDGAIPSGNSIAAFNLLRLAQITMDGKIKEQAQKTLEAFSVSLGRPGVLTAMINAVDFYLGPK
ncbi:MAG: thioredoxin domain-containing protein, partial [Desulfobacterales bacterium]|nr:thioredoxin domain-containing protein [Desulfobacterales bacterium]